MAYDWNGRELLNSTISPGSTRVLRPFCSMKCGPRRGMTICRLSGSDTRIDLGVLDVVINE
ncbi:hypothetical protein SHJG_1270 [Streptomyces hygroscopicus subsp. jinggangensis 5008]|nr:hypothetical protein SHJG_1270 [Streptomyces hygroscopicus subsp. jinggangensis 5008]AGF60771.1 hypothetical protein SHJGH_1105 [Streptomyces hygroscopicus subsp. jinggangensis TL01]